MPLSRLVIAFLCALAALVAAPTTGADIVVGAADNRPRIVPEQAERFYATMSDAGLTENRIAVEWDPQRPTTIPDREALTQAIALATERGIRITLSVYPARANGITGFPGAGARFAAFLAQMAREYPQVKDFIVGNEPNKARFWQPQFAPNRARVACRAYETVLAASYDALKAVDQRITVIGLGLGARGSDNPGARGNLSISPVRCIADIGRAYRSSRRKKPIMDELSYHPYPQSSTDPLEAGYRWPNAGLPDLARIKQAVWDAFHGTAQPVFAERGAPLRPLRFRLNEVGWQVAIPPASRSAYYGRESVPTTDEGTQAAIYGNLLPLLACDPSVRSVLFFNLVDEPDLDRWQSGLLRADWTRRPSYAIVKSAIANRGTRCLGRPVGWRHATKVVGAQIRFGDMGRPRWTTATSWSFPAGAAEAAIFTAGVFPVKKAGTLAAAERSRIVRALRRGRRPSGAVLSARGVVSGWGRVVKFRRQRLKPGYYAYGVRLAAETNPARTTTLVSRAFRVLVRPGDEAKTSAPASRPR